MLSHQISSEASVLGLELDEFLLSLLISSANQHPWCLSPYKDTSQIQLGISLRAEKAMATHSSILAWKTPWMEGPGRLQSMGSLGVELDTTERLPFHFSLSCIGEGNGNPLQRSCLENPRDREPGGLPSMGSHRVRYD